MIQSSTLGMKLLQNYPPTLKFIWTLPGLLQIFLKKIHHCLKKTTSSIYLVIIPGLNFQLFFIIPFSRLFVYSKQGTLNFIFLSWGYFSSTRPTHSHDRGRDNCFRTCYPSVRPSVWGSGRVDHWWHLSCFSLKS